MANMDSNHGCRKVPSLTLPIELSREIGSHLETARELLNFACTSKKVYSAFGLTDMVEIDARAQQGVDLYDYRSGLNRPILLWAIETGKDIDYIQHCIDVYRKSFPRALEGEWYYRLDRSYSSWKYPSPLFAATKAGRLDVIQALLKCGVDFNGWHEGRTGLNNSTHYYKYWGNMGTREAQDQILDDSYRMTRDNDMFQAACRLQNDDIVKLLISKGYKVYYYDLWTATESGSFKVLDTLLLDSIFTEKLGQTIVKATLRLAISHPVADQDIIQPLFNAITVNLKFYQVTFLRNCIVDELSNDFGKKGLIQMVHLLKIYAAMAGPPTNGYEIARAAVKRAGGLEVLKIVLSGHPWTIGKSKSKRLEAMEELFLIAINYGRIEIARFFVTLGLKYSRLSLKAAILAQDTQLIDEVINSGISANTVEHMEFQRPLQFALADSFNNFLPACRLLYHGADPTHISDFQKDLLWRDLWGCYGFQLYICESSDEDLQVITPDRLTCAELPDYDHAFWNPDKNVEYHQLVHAMARVILGDEYWKEFKRRGELGELEQVPGRRRMEGMGKLCRPWDDGRGYFERGPFVQGRLEDLELK